MKILIINSEYPPVGGGAGNASANLARLLAKSGCRVTVVTSAFGGLPDDEVLDGVRVLRGPAVRQYVDRSSAWEQVRFIAAASHRCLSLARIARPDVSLAFFGLPSGAVAWFLQLMLGIPYVVSLRGGDVPGFRPYDFWLYHRIAVPFLHVIWRGAKVVVANSEGLRSLARAFDSRVDIRVVPNGVDTERFAAAERKWDPAIVLSVGRIVHQKGLDVALQALAGLRDLDWHWRIAGDGPELPTLRARIAKAGLASRASFLGWQTSEQLRQEYARANLFLFPSRHEGMPNAMLEAMASGLPVIATRIAGNEELVENEQTGLLVQSEDPDALMSALRRVLPDGVLRAKMGRAGRARAAATYGWEKAASDYRSMLEEAIS